MIYILAVLLKLVGVPVLRDIDWKWFVLAPVLYVFYQVIVRSFIWVLYVLFAFGSLWAIAYFGMWLFS
jgi:hypothetical protein